MLSVFSGRVGGPTGRSVLSCVARSCNPKGLISPRIISLAGPAFQPQDGRKHCATFFAVFKKHLFLPQDGHAIFFSDIIYSLLRSNNIFIFINIVQKEQKEKSKKKENNRGSKLSMNCQVRLVWIFQSVDTQIPTGRTVS